MALKKVKDWTGSNLDVYKVENASDVGAGLVRHIWKGEETATQIGTTLNASVMNTLQESLIHSITATKTLGSGKDIYISTLNGLDEFGIFTGLKILLKVDSENQNTVIKINLNGTEYDLKTIVDGSETNLEVGALKENTDYLITYNGTNFIVSNTGIYGTEKGTALEGKRLAEILGAEFGGNIQDIGNKEKGKIYYDTVNKFYYECLENNNLTYNESTKFRAVSNKPLSDKLENLFSYKFEKIKLTSNKNTTGDFELIACGNIRIIYFFNITVKNDYETIFTLPDWFCKNTKMVTGSCANGTGGAGGETAELFLEPQAKHLKFYPNPRSGFPNDLQLTGQCVTVSIF